MKGTEGKTTTCTICGSQCPPSIVVCESWTENGEHKSTIEAWCPDCKKIEKPIGWDAECPR